MKVKELIEKLQEIDSEYSVLLADWNEDYKAPMKLGKDDFYIDTENQKLIIG